MADYFSFKVKPEKRKPFYFTIKVFHSKRAMMAYYRSQSHRGKQSGFDAVTIPWERLSFADGSKRGIVKPDIGEILFYRPQTATGIVSHEMTHAALHYLRVKKLSLALDDCEGKSEEPLAMCVGSLTRQFFIRY